jgi:hypothetical protein
MHLTAPPMRCAVGPMPAPHEVALTDENVEPVHTRRSGQAELGVQSRLP